MTKDYWYGYWHGMVVSTIIWVVIILATTGCERGQLGKDIEKSIRKHKEK